ncbi:phytanoyl-CoA dioxygenase family protein [Nocardia miyunensis]|uniref:phytanoyl-CoA dioxygenase family protein n=1 Tax=Nocardia miyunensis TaxID=282684 RepID=UPI0008299634|nr:phytanoyl-CoA dioxygenase family protein [Nocardia miyunensis]
MIDEAQREQLREEGFCIFPGALSGRDLDRARTGLDHGIAVTERTLGTTHIPSLDPNAANIRINNLPAIDPIFIELLLRQDALDAVRAVLGEHILVSNFTANIALPGSGSMKLHSDQALTVPPPWPHPWACNIIWCLDDVTEANGATRYLPQSHRFRSLEDVPADAIDATLPFEAPAGSFIVMEGRLWHTSGKNTTSDERRRMMFAYYSSDFIRQQMNWAFTLPAEVQAEMSRAARHLFGLAPMGNTRIGAQLTTLDDGAHQRA